MTWWPLPWARDRQAPAVEPAWKLGCMRTRAWWARALRSARNSVLVILGIEYLGHKQAASGRRRSRGRAVRRGVEGRLAGHGPPSRWSLETARASASWAGEEWARRVRTLRALASPELASWLSAGSRAQRVCLLLRACQVGPAGSEPPLLRPYHFPATAARAQGPRLPDWR
jgi:hypothetical protein